MDGALVVRRGRPEQVVAKVAEEAGRRQRHITAERPTHGNVTRGCASARSATAVRWWPPASPYAVGPGSVLKRDGTPFQVFYALLEGLA